MIIILEIASSMNGTAFVSSAVFAAVTLVDLAVVSVLLDDTFVPVLPPDLTIVDVLAPVLPGAVDIVPAFFVGATETGFVVGVILPGLTVGVTETGFVVGVILPGLTVGVTVSGFVVGVIVSFSYSPLRAICAVPSSVSSSLPSQEHLSTCIP